MDYKNILKTGAFIAASTLYTSCDEAPKEIHAEGFPKGYQIENADISTRGEIIRVKKLPGENYQKTVDSITGIITFKGNFEYEIKPLRSAMPKSPEHSDIYGRTPENNDYWKAVREGKVTLRVDTESLENKLKK
jgi:hypothetical protein